MLRSITSKVSVSAVIVTLIATTANAGDNEIQTRQVQVPQAEVQQQYQVQVPQQDVIVDNGFNGGHQGGNAVRQVIIDDGNGQGLAFFSSRLGARFLIQSIQVGNFPSVMAARIVSDPMPGSPLEQLNLEIGDVITRLDGIPVTNTAELGRHIFDTKVRFVKAGFNTVSQGTMWIDQNRYFQETFYPPSQAPWNSQCSTCGLRP